MLRARQLTEREARNAELARLLEAPDMTIAALEDLMSWLVTAPLRHLGAESQAVWLHIRRAAKLVWRLLTS